MTGKILVIIILGSSLLVGAAIYYMQVYAYYYEIDPETLDLRLTSVASGQPEPIAAGDISAIDANSSPLRFRACFTIDDSLAGLAETYVRYDDPTPLIAPGWFDCFDAAAIGEALENDLATGFLAEAEIRDGVDRVIAVFPDGRAYAWHQLNDKYDE